jgi:hypothetical protein
MTKFLDDRLGEIFQTPKPKRKKKPKTIPISKDKKTQKIYKDLTDFMAKELKGL